MGKKREIDEAEVAKYALAGCYDKTIARLTGIPETTLKDRCRDLISKKRAERKYIILVAQNKAVKLGVPSMLIFLGKNYLKQTDRQDLNLGGQKDNPLNFVELVKKANESKPV